jgi:hypothetical protein
METARASGDDVETPFRAVLRTDEVLGLTRKIQPASVNDPVTKGKRLPKFWAGCKAIREPGSAL